MTAPVAAPDVVGEPHRERPATPRDGCCDYCHRLAFVVYLLPGGVTVRWCGRPETGTTP